jgi:hypothetical protein
MRKNRIFNRLDHAFQLIITAALVYLVLAKAAVLYQNTFDSPDGTGEASLLWQVNASKDEGGLIETVEYREDGITASYPKVLSGGSEESVNRWNQIIKQDFDKILQIYSFQPFPGPTPLPTGTVPRILNISYELMENSSDLLSILYRADFNSSYSAHPSNLVYTTNIDKRKDQRLRLGDVVRLDNAFVREFRTWKISSAAEDTKEIDQAIYDYIGNITDEELLQGFRLADVIGSGNPWGIFSYQRDGVLGISIGVPNYAGDHAEFEKPLSQLKDFLHTKA